MIKSMHIENFKCFKDFDIDLDPFTVLIGPNDSGKTAFLQALRLLSAVAEHFNFGKSDLSDFREFPLGVEAVWRNDRSLDVGFRVWGPRDIGSDGQQYVVVTGRRCTRFKGKLVSESPTGTVTDERSDDQLIQALKSTVGKAGYYRFDPRQLRQPSELKKDLLRMSEAGNGLPTFLQGIWGKNRDAFLSLEREFYARLPEYKRFRLEPKAIPEVQDDGRLGQALYFDTRHGESLSAESVSDGALITLAFLAISHQPDPPNILLIEEPENGVHHARLAEIIETLRHLNREKGVQIVLTTHSPYLLDLAEPEEVRVFAKDEEGAIHQKRLSDHPEVQSLKKHFMTGEIWTSLSETQEIRADPGADLA